MKVHMLIIVCFGLHVVPSQTDDICKNDVKQKCIDMHKSYVEPVISLLKRLSEETQTANLPEATGEPQSECTSSSESPYHEERLYDSINVGWKPIKTCQGVSIKLKVDRIASSEETNKFRERCFEQFSPTLCPLVMPCITHATRDSNVDKTTDPTTSAEIDHGDESTRSAEQQTSCKEEKQEQTYIIITCIVSFLGGVLSTFFILCLYLRISRSREKANDTVGEHPSALNHGMLSERHCNINVDQKTYDSLRNTENAVTARPASDHVYLGIGTKAKADNTEMFGGPSRRMKENGSHKQSKTYEQTDTPAAEHHDYKPLADDDTNHYESTNVEDSKDHTYSGIKPLDTRQDSSVPELPHDHQGEDRNYFLLKNDGPLMTKEEIVETHHEKGAKDKDPYCIDHAYFTLGKDESFVCTFREFTNDHDLTIETNRGSDGHTYNTLEKI